MSDSTSLENLKACKDAVDNFKRILLENEEITKNNSDKTALYRAAKAVWDARKQAADDKLNRWRNKTGEYQRWNNILASKDDKFWPDYCWGTGGCRDIQKSGDTDWQCGNKAESMGKYDSSGFVSDGNTQACGYDDGACIRNRRMRCSRSDSSKQKIQNDYNADMPTFTEPEPKDKEGVYAYDPTYPNDGNIQCCANIFKINTGDVNNVKQTCSQQIDQSIILAQAGGSIPSKETIKNENNQNPQQEQEPESESNENIIIIIIVVVLLLLTSSSIGGLFMLNTGEE